MQSTEWRPVVGYEGLYEVSDTGKVRSVPRVIEGKDGRLIFYRNYKEIRPRVKPSGHHRVGLRRNGDLEHRYVHRMVLESFIGPCPEGMVACHYDDDPTNNAVINLRWDTFASNQLDAVRNRLNANTKKTHCPLGHAYAGSNLYVFRGESGTNHRSCKSCSAARAYAVKRGEPMSADRADAIYKKHMEKAS